LFCGIASGSDDHRARYSRVWHLPKDAIIAVGDVQGYSHQGKQVKWFELHRDSVPVEESYTPVSLGHETKLALPSASLADEPSVFAARVAERVRAPVVRPGAAAPPGENFVIAKTVHGDHTHGLACAALRAAGGYCQLTTYQQDNGMPASDTEMSL
jgi:hypothetical protein